MVDDVIAYCSTMLLWDPLLAAVKESRPSQYDRFVSGLLQRREVSGAAPPHAHDPSVDTAALRARLQRLDAVEIEGLCLDHFPAVYDKFGRGQRRDEMINLLLDHCRRNPEDGARLADLV
jgi:hypothetical protein